MTSFILEADSATTALLKVIEVERDTRNVVTYTHVSTFRIPPSGALTWLREDEGDGSDALTVNY